ncbi:TPA: hypothetical protein U1C36_002306 [Streptococcus suis]|nr:hypothetical protein [Streptococcus suis]
MSNDCKEVVSNGKFLTENASLELVNGILLLADRLATEKLHNQQQRPVKQKELMELYGFDYKYLSKLRAFGLRGRKQGKSIYYDLRDVDRILEQLKQ